MISLLIGIWVSSCIQTQFNDKQGFAIEAYSIHSSGSYEFTRTWYSDSSCSVEKSEDRELGTLSVGDKVSGMFIQQKTYEVDFESEGNKDLGAVAVGQNSLKFARGMKNSQMRNTMVGLFEYQRSK